MPELSFADQDLLKNACSAFGQTTRVFSATPATKRDFSSTMVDAAIDFRVDGKKFRMPVSIQGKINVHGPVLAAQRLYSTEAEDQGKRPLMLVASFIDPVFARHLVDRNQPFLDAAGNVFLREPEATIMVTGQPKPEAVSTRAVARATTRKGLHVMFALATQKGLLNAPYRTIAEASGVALSTVSDVVDDLTDRGFVATRRSGERMIPDWQKYVQEWVSLYPSRLRAKLKSARFASTNPEWWRSFNFETLHGLLGGEAGADLVTGNLRPAQVTVYSQVLPGNEFMLKGRLRPDPAGDVEVLQAFWPEGLARSWWNGNVQLVHPLLIYADLIASGDSRNLEIAQTINEQYLSSPAA